MIPPTILSLNYHSNLIYLITCDPCHLQYVGETVQSLNERSNWHKSGFCHPKKHGHCRILCERLNKELCERAKYKVQIVEKLEGCGRTSRNAVDSSSTKYRKKRGFLHQTVQDGLSVRFK